MESPLVAIIASSVAEYRDPSTLQPVDVNITLTLNDLNKEGHLLSLSVLPHVLRSERNLDDALSKFAVALRMWAEPVEQEMFHTYLACIFVVSCSEDNPLVMFEDDKHSTGESKCFTPSHCSPPKWTSPNTLKHYFLLYDASIDEESRCNSLFNEMCSTYGVDSCQTLTIGQGKDISGVSNVWCDADDLDIVLNSGLRRALQHATASAVVYQTLEREEPSAPSTVSTISPSYAMVQPSTALTELNGFAELRNFEQWLIFAYDLNSFSVLYDLFNLHSPAIFGMSMELK
ncbi:hypothetical protein DICVIV_08538 [Dictyocaulus viviparus]|uniref:Uncharacterized protein n=1 Tax=Dictyocaulus viviparus TaxID=29172 RepID=A0A0D8XNP1_DICVI|nr:hypothetical protein DICVIV_08538 [Dictyocaulus viviparus]